MKKRLLPYIILFAVLSLLSAPSCFGGSTSIKTLLITLEGTSDSTIADTLYQIGSSHYKEKNYSSSIQYLKKASQYHLKYGNQEATINDLNLIGHSYIKLKKFNTALKNYIVALELSEKIKDNKLKAKILNSIGRYYSFLNDYEKSLLYYHKSLEIIELADLDIETKAKVLNNIGMCYGYINEADKALEYFNRSLPLRYQIGNKEDISILINNIGYAYTLKGDYNKALEQFNISLSICEEISDKQGTTYALLNIAELHINNQKHEEAIPILLRTLNLAKEIKLDVLIIDSYKFLSQAYEEIGDSKKGLDYYKKYNEIQQKQFQEEYENKLGNVKIFNNLRIKKQEINQLSKESLIKELKLKSNQNFIFSLLILLFIFSVFFIVFYFQNKRLKKANKILVFKNLEIVENENKLKKIHKGISTTEDKLTITTLSNNNSKYTKSPLSEQQKSVILEHIMTQIEQEKLFLNEDLTLIMLSDIIDTNKSYVSQIINEKFEKNFSSFINEYRIKEARILLAQEGNWVLTIEAISNSVGFKSISAFNAAFKKYTGITPSYFINTVKSNSTED